MGANSTQRQAVTVDNLVVADDAKTWRIAGKVFFVVTVLIAIAMIVVAVLVFWVFSFDDGLVSTSHDDLADWEQADTMALVFDVEWPASTQNVNYVENVWFSYAYEIRADMARQDALALLDAVPNCEPLTAIPNARVEASWWNVEQAQQWQGCGTDTAARSWNWIVVDLSDQSAPQVPVYLAHFQPDT